MENGLKTWQLCFVVSASDCRFGKLLSYIPVRTNSILGTDKHMQLDSVILVIRRGSKLVVSRIHYMIHSACRDCVALRDHLAAGFCLVLSRLLV
jgi:hypothetical protein